MSGYHVFFFDGEVDYSYLALNTLVSGYFYPLLTIALISILHEIPKYLQNWQNADKVEDCVSRINYKIKLVAYAIVIVFLLVTLTSWLTINITDKYTPIFQSIHK